MTPAKSPIYVSTSAVAVVFMTACPTTNAHMAQ